MHSRFGYYARLAAAFAAGLIIAYLGAGGFAEQKVAPRAVVAAAPEIPRMPDDTRERVVRAVEPERITVRDNFADPFAKKEPAQAAPKKERLVGLRGMAERLGVPEAPTQLAPPNFSTRYEAWQREVKRAQASDRPAPPVTTAYLYSEVEPIGIVRGGASPQVDALVYCKPEGRSFAAKVGARFFDAKLERVTPEGIVFETLQGPVFVEWAPEKEQRQAPPARKATPGLQPTPAPTPAEQKAAEVSEAPAPAPARAPEKEAAPARAAGAETAKIEGAPASVKVNESASAARTPQAEATASALESGAAAETASVETSTFTAPRRFKLFGPAAYGRGLAAARGPLAGDTLFNHGYAKFDPRSALALRASSAPATFPLISTREIWAQAAPSHKVSAQDNLQGTRDDLSTGGVTSAAAPKRPAPGTFCDPGFQGESYSLATTRKLQLIELFEDLYDRYKVNFIIDPEIQSLPVRLSIVKAPWTTIVRALLDVYDLEPVCMDSGIVKIVARTKVTKQEDDRRKTAPIVREVFKLKYIQPQAGGRLNAAGQAQGGPGGNLQTLEETIRGILRAGGDQRGDVRRVPGRSELIVAGTEEQIQEVRELIKRVDRPSYQVVIQALVYTVSDTKLRDIGTQASIIIGNASGRQLGGVSSLPNAAQTGTGAGGQTGPSSLNPGGIGGLPSGFTQPTAGLQAANPLAVIGASTIVGTAQFAVQISAAEKRGAANIQARPFGAVADGSTIDLVAGSQIPVVTTAIGGGAVVQTGQVQFLEASRVLRITPQVAEDEAGNPTYVTLQVQLENNAVDTSLPAFGGLPALSRQSLQTVIRLKDGQTGVIGGLSADSVSKTKAKVPGMGDVPVIGNLFKRTTDQISHDKLYFAITATVIPQDAAVESAQAPSDATTKVGPPPAPQSSIKTVK